MRSDQIPLRPEGGAQNTVARVAEHLSRLIAGGLLGPGDKLPGETVLARRLGVSRPTLREAISILRGRGLVEVRPRSGTFVTSALSRGGMNAIEELLAIDPRKVWDLIEIRRVVDAGAAALAAARRTGDDLAELRRVRERVEAMDGSALLSSLEGGKAYGQFFAGLARATHNTLYSHLVESVSRMLRDAFRFSQARLGRLPGAGDAIVGQLGAILEAVERGEPELARQAMVEHLDYLEASLRALSG